MGNQGVVSARMVRIGQSCRRMRPGVRSLVNGNAGQEISGGILDVTRLVGRQPTRIYVEAAFWRRPAAVISRRGRNLKAWLSAVYRHQLQSNNKHLPSAPKRGLNRSVMFRRQNSIHKRDDPEWPAKRRTFSTNARVGLIRIKGGRRYWCVFRSGNMRP